MKRRALNVLSAVSLLLCITTAVVWAAGIGIHTSWVLGHPLPHNWGWMAGTVQNNRPTQFMIGIYKSPPTPFVGPKFPLNGNPSPAFLAWLARFGTVLGFNQFGFAAVRFPFIYGSPAGNIILTRTGWCIFIPRYALVAAFAIAPAIWCFQTRRLIATNRRRKEGQCLACGYDLRATPDRCPECGEVPKKTARISV